MLFKIVMYAIAALLIVGGLLYTYLPLETFNLFIPKDAGSRLLIGDVAYGPDPRHRLDIYAPTEGKGPWPVVVFVHGGSWSSGNKNPYEFVGRALAAQGYLVLVPNYRLHPEHPYPAFVEDAALTIDWATRHASEYGGDQSHVFVSGHSAGAYNVAMAVLDKHYLAALGTDAFAIKGVALLAGPLDFLPLDSKISIDVFGRVADLPSTQPVNFVRADAPPFLILHGTEDQTCYPRNSVSLDAKLRAAGASSTLKLYDGVSHVGIMIALAKPLRSRTPTLADMVVFFTSH
ncbi:alpha/beta hydrolase [Aestuariivirga litoralis]|uniref:alpha/beta hydrolase n=1 Tax=Aestuariivirga litoralis TaxID=2650924 RepID=UPI0018C72FD7|nr:alpha/beta hydrolase [Aestuariivirga litoralis]